MDKSDHSERRRVPRMYVGLLNGRNAKAQVLEDAGFEGPIVGPLGIVQWSHGLLNLFSAAC